jgi:small subunit ribosomal protein S6e
LRRERGTIANFKLVVSDPKTGKARTYELKESQAQLFVGTKIGDIIDGTVVGVPGKVKVTGGSDKSGFPMRRDVLGGVKKYVLLTKGVGFKKSSAGEKKRKLVRGNTITDEIFQVNAVISA